MAKVGTGFDDVDMDLCDMLLQDHELLRALFALWEEGRLPTDNEKKTWANEIIRDLKLHSHLEEQLFYPTLKKQIKHKGEQLAEEGLRDHRKLDEDLNEWARLDPTDHQWLLKLRFVRTV